MSSTVSTSSLSLTWWYCYVISRKQKYLLPGQIQFLNFLVEFDLEDEFTGEFIERESILGEDINRNVSIYVFTDSTRSVAMRTSYNFTAKDFAVEDYANLAVGFEIKAVILALDRNNLALMVYSILTILVSFRKIHTRFAQSVGGG
ncbi:hypothetical protein Tco_0857118 [Tanacetum coccineum]|uniref:Uncharacterized protein n=1 Tax=Tanacetum coccineum TaxID=301880 RepID=A0ABQ5B623_9ASTR